jgi:PAS domain S-box-containing protein
MAKRKFAASSGSPSYRDGSSRAKRGEAKGAGILSETKVLLRAARKDLAETLRALRVSETRSRTQAEQLRELSDELNTTLNTAGVGITRCSRDLRYLRANETYAKIVGLPLGEIIGRPIVEVVGEAAFETIRPCIERVLAGERVEYESVVPLARGQENSFFRVVAVPDRDSNGSVIGWIACVADITSSKQAENRLAERNAQLDLAGKLAKIGSFTYDHATRKLQLSPGCAALYGLPEGTFELSRKEWRALVHPEDLPKLDAKAGRALANGESEVLLEFRTVRHGEMRWIESRTLISYNEAGKPVRRIGAQIDVTERKQAEEALAERNTQLELTHKAARVGSYTYDVSAGMMRLSRANNVTYGLSERTLEITDQQWLSRVHRDDNQRLRAEHIRAFKEQRPELVSEFRIVRPGGEVRWIETRSLIAYDHAGRAVRMTGVYIDVTERRSGEDHKKMLIAELDHRVKNMLACVAAISKRSQERSRSVKEFLDVLNGRINSLANAHALLSRSRWEGVGLGELVRSELAFCAKDETALIEGPEVDLAAMATQALAMVLHELTTNAAKYGALSNRHGRVMVRWRRQSRGPSRGKLVLEWRETGGPTVVEPKATGYGTSVIRNLVPYELGGTVDYVLVPDGIRCKIEIPARWYEMSESSPALST